MTATAAAEAAEPLTYTIEEAAQLLRVSRGLAYSMAKSGELPVIHAGTKRLLVSRAKLHRMLEGEG